MKGSAARLEDSKRIDRVLFDLNMKYMDRKHKASSNSNQHHHHQPPSITMNNKAVKMLIDYSTELVTSILESSCLLAQHRNSKVVDEEDVNIILGLVTIYKITSINYL